ncbi:50S ribosomal protein L19e [Candidatus Woesearchaeota archaeon]|nr:50S ribosomal protein L19e [Candidatus Woesearchaeota archaeon]
MNVRNQRRVVARSFNVGIDRVKLDPGKLTEIKEAITKADLKSLISTGAISIIKKKGHSKVRSRKIKIQKSKGRRKGIGSKKGRKTSRSPRKKFWMASIRAQRKFIKQLKTKGVITKPVYRDIYRKTKSNRFRSIRLIKLYLEDNNLTNKNATKKKK